MLLALNSTNESVLLFNIPRDTLTELIGRGIGDKINHAYAYGGIDMTVNTVESFLDVPIDFYVKVNMEKFINIIDTLGGVKIHNPFAFDYEGFTFPKGDISLEGKSALAFTRMRYDDTKGDLGRNERQRQILKSIISKGIDLKTMTKLGNVLEVIEQSVKTNIPFEVMKQLIKEHRTGIKNIEAIELQGEGRIDNGIYYYIINPEERLKLKEKLKKFSNTRASAIDK